MQQIIGTKDKGVSPVIATILMVAITVVLAATVYLMVSGYMTGPSHPPMAASLTVTSTNYNPTAGKGYYNITLSMTTPATATPANVHFAVNNTALTHSSNTWTNKIGTTTYTITWYDVNGNGLVDSGDVFYVVASNSGSSIAGAGAVISLSIPTGATGTTTVTLPTA